MLRYESFLEEAGRRGAGHPLGLDPIIGYLALHALDRAFEFGLDSIPPRHVATRVMAEALMLPDECPCKRQYVALVEALRRGGSWDVVAVRLSELGDALERDGRYREAEDVFRALVALHEQPGAAELCGQSSVVSAFLGCARTLRKQGAFDEAQRWYRRAQQRAHEGNLADLEVSARVGLARLAIERGNYPKAQKILDEIHKDFVDAPLSPHARGSIFHEMGMVARSREPSSALRLFWEAYEAYADPADRERALFDIAAELAQLGHQEPARKALEVLCRDSTDSETKLISLKTLVYIAAETADQILFARVWPELERRLAIAPPRIRADALIQAGRYYRTVGRDAAGVELLGKALAECRIYGLNEWLIAAEQALEEEPRRVRPTAVPDPTVGLVSEAVDDLWRQKTAV